MKNNIVVNILGDIYITEDNKQIINSDRFKKLFNGIFETLNNATINIANLEGPLANISDKPILKTGPNLKNPIKLLDSLVNSNIGVLTLGNNHILDYGDNALFNTINEIEKRGLKYVGAGKNLEEAKKPLIIEVEGIKIGVINFAEHEFNTANVYSPGANGFDCLYSFDEISRLKSKCKYLIVVYHGGIEYHKYPSPWLRSICRKMVESGADVVITQQSHCIGTKEEYLNGEILYGQGNTVFGYKRNNNDWNHGLIVQLVIDSDSLKVNYVPIEAIEGGGIDLMKDNLKEQVMRGFKKRSDKIYQKEFIEKEWVRFCNSKKSIYLGHLFGFNRYLIFLNRKLNNKIIDIYFSRRKKMIVHNLVRCESHHEVLETILKN